MTTQNSLEGISFRGSKVISQNNPFDLSLIDFIPPLYGLWNYVRRTGKEVKRMRGSLEQEQREGKKIDNLTFEQIIKRINQGYRNLGILFLYHTTIICDVPLYYAQEIRDGVEKFLQ